MAPDATQSGMVSGRRTVQFVSLTTVTEVARAIRKAAYFSEEQKLRPKGWFSFEGMKSEERDALICWKAVDDAPPNIGLRGRMWAITGLVGPLGAPAGYVSMVTGKIAQYATLKKVEETLPDDINLRRCKATLEQLIQSRVVAAKPLALTDKDTIAKVGKNAPLTCSTTIENSNCILWAVDYVVEVARASNIPRLNGDAEALRKALVNVLFETGTDAQRIPRPHADPAELFLALAQVTGLHDTHEDSATAESDSNTDARTEDHPVDTPNSYIQPGLKQYAGKGSAGSRAGDIDRTVATITRSLGSIEPTTDDCATLILLWGKEQSGKKAVVGDLLRSLRIGKGDTENYRFPLRAADGSLMTDLPVFAMISQRVHYRELLIELFVFLNLHKPLENREEPVLDETLRAEAEWMLGKKPNGSSLLEEIDRLHAQVPALFIFSDVHGYSRDGLQTILVQNGIYKLLDVLSRTMSRSRFLITQEYDNFTDWERRPEEQVLRLIPMKMPRLDRFSWYPSEANVARYETPAFDSLRARDQEDPVELSGYGLLSMSALLALEPETKEVVAAFEDYVFGPKDAEENETPEDRHQRLNIRLLSCFNRQGIDDVILMIAATSLIDDWLSDPTLKRMIRKWRGLQDDEFEQVWQEVIATLRTLEEGTQTLYVNGKINPHVDREELSYREELVLSDPDSPPVLEWRMSRSVAQALLDHVYHMPNVAKILRQIFRLLAQESHRRAQTKRVRRVKADSSRLEIARDMQSLQALLASLPPVLTARKDLDKAPFGALRLRVEDVFGLAGHQEPELALRYAVLLLLRRDIDPDHMLSMVTDQDELRLNLYIRLFMPLGQIHTFSVSDLRGQAAVRALPSEVPPHLLAALHKSEIMELLLSIAVAAFLSQLEEIIAWARRLAETLMLYLGDEADTACRTAYTRLCCVRFDAAILQGVAHSPAERPDANNQTLGAVWTQVQATWANWYKTHVTQSDPNIDPILARVAMRMGLPPVEPTLANDQFELALAAPARQVRSASLADGVRLLARAAELEWMIEDEDALRGLPWQDSLHGAIIALEDQVARQRGDAQSPVALSGRTGRRIIRALTDDPLVLAYPHTEGYSEQSQLQENMEKHQIIRVIWHTNAARLGQFYAGADRLYTLLDYARFKASEKRLEIAARVLQDCVEALGDSLISLQGRVEILLADQACKILLAFRSWQETGQLPSAGDAAQHVLEVDALIRVAQSHNLRPIVCEAHLVAGRAEILNGLTRQTKWPDPFSRAKKRFATAEFLAREIGYKRAAKCNEAWFSFLSNL